jgi:hypothetical protein
VIKFVSELVFSTNKTEILLKVALNTKNPPSNKQTKTHVKYFDIGGRPTKGVFDLQFDKRRTQIYLKINE